jgi:hypothetical protein
MALRSLLIGVPSVVAVSLALAAPGASHPTPQASAAAFNTKCGVFPKADGVGTDAPSLPDQRAWNQDISHTPVRPDSGRIIDFINSKGATDLHPDFGSEKIYGIPYKVVGGGQKKVKVKFTAYGDESDKGPYRMPLSTPIEGGKNGDGDRHAVVYDKSRCLLYELYRAFPKGKKWEAESGAIWNLRSAGLRKVGFTSADAAGLPVFPGLIRMDEIQKGAINHAIRVTFDTTRDAYVFPASHCASNTSAAGAPPMGLRLRLKASYDTSGMTGQAAIIATALKRYGFIVADNGSNWFFQGAPNRNWDGDDLNQLKEVPGSAFEAVKSQAPDTAC